MFTSIKKINYELYLLLITFIGSIIIIVVNNTNLTQLIILNTIFFIPFFIYFSKGSELIYNKKFPYFEAIILLIYIYYFLIFFFDYERILFTFLQDDSDRQKKLLIDTSIINKNLIIDKVLLIYIFSITTLIASYYFFRNLLDKIKSENTIFFKDQNHIEKIGYILFFLFFALDYFSYSKNVAIVSEIKTVIIYTSVLFLFLQSDNGFKSSLKYFLISFLLLYYVPKTFIAPIINISILILLLDWFLRKKINFLILGIFFVTFFIVMQTKTFHRYNLERYNTNTENITIKENLIIYTKYSIKKMLIDKGKHLQKLSIERKTIKKDVSSQLEAIKEDVSSQLEAIMEDVSSQLEPEDVSSQLEAIKEDVSSQLEVIMEDISSQLELEDVSSQLELEDVSSQLEAIMEDVSSQLESEDVSSQLEAIKEDVLSRLELEDVSSQLELEDVSSQLEAIKEDVSIQVVQKPFFDVKAIGHLKRLAMPSITLVHTLQFNDVAESYIGKTILFPFYSLVPSVIWKNKPSFNFGNKFGHDFYFLHDIDFKTSVNIPLITELYLNHYYKGLLIGMLLFGFLISLVEFLISKFFNKDNILQLIFIACTFSFTYLETSAIFIINGFSTKLIFMLTFVFIINKILVLISKIINK